MNETVNIIKKIMRKICTSAGMVYHYGDWDNETKIKEIDESFNLFYEEKKFQFDPNTLTKEELIEVGFREWDENLMLIPIYLYSYIYPNLVCESINGNEKLISDVDLDVRFGCLAYGFYPKNYEKD